MRTLKQQKEIYNKAHVALMDSLQKRRPDLTKAQLSVNVDYMIKLLSRKYPRSHVLTLWDSLRTPKSKKLVSTSAKKQVPVYIQKLKKS